ncbi:dihydrodipicolinate reductase [Frankia sp. R43]|uniref:NAD(P)H-dependent amine dehydrogenase family protein n=1 Tax=Frankia sp. R43 TaxID=269536 RepID=UPI0006CA0A3A|nr:dihydrodipicolinate reductase [Frankia sp. R43]KPM55917.1 dihydrodipicolinate reductase [Frankia sp. R43]
MSRRLRVVQWTTGKTGRAAVRGMVGHPVLDLVGCYAHAPDKVGRDVGELCGLDPIGVLATDDVEALLALEPDCVSYMAYRPNFDHLERILESGVNVVSTMYMMAGFGYGQEATHRLRDACLRGGSSLYASGIYPGHAPNVALAASAMCSRIERVSILESLDIVGYANEQMFRAQGFDLLPEDPAAALACEASCGSFKDQIPVLAKELGVRIDRVGFRVEFATANEDTDFGFMTVRKGHIAGFRGTVSGDRDGRSLIECSFVWKLGADMTPKWPVTHGYIIELDGDPGVRVRLEPQGDHLDGTVTTALPAVNAIPQVCAAPPGIVNLTGLPFVRGAHQLRP